jgi:hypothetical protein
VSPDIRRLLPEIFRRVAIPYYGGFTTEQRVSFANIVRIALGDDAIAKKATVRTRLTGPGIGEWVCPRKEQPSRRPSASSESRSALVHPKTYQEAGRCPVVDETGKICNMPLRPQETHWDEFAVAFGFLEDTDGSYIRGKYGLVSEFLTTTKSDTEYFDTQRALRALFLYTLLERHGDFLVPALQIARQNNQTASDQFLQEVRSSLQLKVDRAAGSGLPRNAAYHAMDEGLHRFSAEWNVASARTRGTGVSLAQRLTKPLSEKTLSGYYGRTLSYLEEVGALERRGSNKNIIALTDLGARFWRSLGVIGLGEAGTLEVPPSFETIHDAFSVDQEKYESTFRPPITQGRFERVIRSTLLPDRPTTPWRLSEDNFKRLYPEVVFALGERLSGAARLDVVRLALFTHSIGAARAVEFDDDERDLNANLVVDIAREDPSHYLLGHARTGRRFWSVALVRR